MRRIGVWLGSYGADIRDALQSAAADGFTDVHASALVGTLAPGELSESGRRHIAKIIDGHGLRLDGLALEFPGEGLADAGRADQRLDHLAQTVKLAAKLRASRVVVRVGGFGADGPAPLTRNVLQNAADLADRSGVLVAVLAAEGGTQRAAPHVRAVGCARLAVAVDTLDTPDIAEVEVAVGESLGCVYVRDAKRRGGFVEEAAFGAGEVDFDRLLAWMEQCRSAGPPVVRTSAALSAGGMRRAREALRSRLGAT